VENLHQHGILDQTHAPARIEKRLQEEAQELATHLAEALNLVGLLAVEFFVTKDDQLIFNEMAPRPHNSGHWTQDGCSVSQFEQFVRAVTGLPLKTPELTIPTVMHNLIGNDVRDLSIWSENPSAHIHLYGKNHIKPGRKMGHVNVCIPKPT
jgi:5-(carboxyamino)imidazole ribonucleotide synthase